VFIHTEMGAHILPEGWHNWSRPEAERTVFYAEHGNTSPGAADGQRVQWSRQLSRREARRHTPEKILGKHQGKYWFLSGD
jgi:pectinesterase